MLFFLVFESTHAQLCSGVRKAAACSSLLISVLFQSPDCSDLPPNHLFVLLLVLRHRLFLPEFFTEFYFVFCAGVVPKPAGEVA